MNSKIYLYTSGIGWEQFSSNNTGELAKRNIKIGKGTWIGNDVRIGKWTSTGDRARISEGARIGDWGKR